MAENSKIEWTTHTFNPWIGCTRVSPACDHCYAAELSGRYGWAKWGVGEPRKKTSPSNWQKPLAWNRAAERTGVRPTVFCASLADAFDNEVSPLWRRELFALIAATPNLIWLLLTKRIGNAVKMIEPIGLFPPNAAIGATMANQEEYDRDRIKLKQAGDSLGALFTFMSCEPMLGPVILDCNAPDWIICGGESGRAARDMPTRWAERLAEQSMALGRAFFMKQMARKAPIPTHLMIRQFPTAIAGTPSKGRESKARAA